MYEFKPVTDRIARMRDKVRDRLIIADSEKLRIKAEATAKYRNFPPVIKKPMESLYVISNMPMDIEEDEYFVGDLGGKNWGGSSGRMWLSADIEHTWPIEADGLHHAPDDDPLYSHQKLAVSPEELKKLREISAEQAREFGGIRPEQWLPDGAEQLFSLQACTYGRPGGFPVLMMPGHLTPGFQTILKRGYGDIRKQAQDWLDERQGNVMGDDMDKYLFYKAATVACDGAITLTRRYAKIAAEKAKTAPTPERAAELTRMAESLEWIAEKPARTFWEACQQVMLYHVFLMVDNGPGVTSMGRFDQHVWPYLKKELDEGTITMDYAQELVDAFFLKLNIFFGGGFGKQAQTAGIGHIGQHTTIGGCIPETGEDATNPVSYMVLESIARLQLHEPTVSLRTSSKTPDGIWNAALATSMRVGGLPLLQNDEVIIPGIIRELGFSLEDARNYAFIGCQEITGSGNDYPAPNGSAMGHNGIYWSIAITMAINNGINPMNGRQAPECARSGYLYEMKSIDDVRAALEKLARWMLTWSATLNNYAEHEFPRLYPYPNLSISTEGCMESGRDVSEGGAKYNSYGGTATGLATVADSITAIKYMVFDKKLVSAKEFLDAILANWEGYEVLRQRVMNEVPHYGNADPYADQELQWVMDLYYNITRAFHNSRCKVYKCGMFGAADHVAQGEITWATPDGRKTGEPIADAMSPAQGRDVNGPTSVFISSCCFDHSRYLDGMAVNLKIHPTALRGDDGVGKLRDMTKTYFEKGGMECQYNVVDAKTLRDAQEHPEDYHNLVVRIAGYSAYFVDMTEAMQNDIISRAEHNF
jgi:formate C-acetyltransferase